MTGLVVYAVSLAVYALTAGAAVGWLDAPELVAASSSLGVAHSPGHPAVIMLGKLGTLVPVGDIPFRVSLMSAAAGAGAATVTFVLARGLFAVALPAHRRSVTVMAAATAWVTAFAWAAWIQNVRAEVYALEALLVIGALAAALAYYRDGRARYLLLAALLAGLAISNHHAIAATVLLPVAGLILWRRPSWRALGPAMALGVVGLSAWAYLPVRAATNPALNWGAPSTASRFVWTITGQAFHKSASSEHVSTRGQDAAQALVAIGSGSTVPLFFLAFLTVYLAIRRRQQHGPVLALITVIVLGVGLRAVLGFDPETPDHHGYLWPAMVAVVVLGVLGIAQLAALLEARGEARPFSALAPQAAAIALMALVGVAFATNAGRSNQASVAASDTLAIRGINAVPPRTLLLTAYFETRFQLAAAREVFGTRPDVDILDRSLLTYPGAAASETRRFPGLAALIAAPLRAGEPSPLALLDAAGHTRSIRVELHPNVDSALRSRLVPRGAFAIYAPRESIDATRSEIEPIDDADVRALTAELASAAGNDDAERVERALLWRDFLRLEHYCDFDRVAAARSTWARLRSRSPELSGDRTLLELASRCRLEVP